VTPSVASRTGPPNSWVRDASGPLCTAYPFFYHRYDSELFCEHKNPDDRLGGQWGLDVTSSGRCRRASARGMRGIGAKIPVTSPSAACALRAASTTAVTSLTSHATWCLRSALTAIRDAINSSAREPDTLWPGSHRRRRTPNDLCARVHEDLFFAATVGTALAGPCRRSGFRLKHQVPSCGTSSCIAVPHRSSYHRT
jgi:hypothetical protein